MSVVLREKSHNRAHETSRGGMCAIDRRAWAQAVADIIAASIARAACNGERVAARRRELRETLRECMPRAIVVFRSSGHRVDEVRCRCRAHCLLIANAIHAAEDRGVSLRQRMRRNRQAFDKYMDGRN